MPGIGRKPKSEKFYRRHTLSVQARNICEFCTFISSHNEVVSEYKHFWIVRNIFPYDFWDTRTVTDHLLVIPKRHIESLSELDTQEKVEYTDILGVYDMKGYSNYARAPISTMKSVAHHHTHLMTLANKPVRFVVFARKPHIHWTR